MDFSFRFGARHEQDLQSPVVDHSGETVAGHQEQVSDADVARVDIRLHFGARADAARDDVAVGVVARLLRRQVPGVDLLLDVGVVLGELPELAVAEPSSSGAI